MHSEIANIDVALIYRTPNGRPVEKGRVDDLVKSIQLIGLLNPIIVKRAKHYRCAGQIDAFDVVAGNHRYEAALKLKWHELPCKIIDADALLTELVEIDENLIRHNFTSAQKAAAIARRKAIYEELHPETRQHVAGAHAANKAMGNDASEKSALAFAQSTSEATGKSRRSVEIAAARGAALGDDLLEIVGTSLDKGVELDALAKMKPEERKPIVERAKAGERVSARKQTTARGNPSRSAPAAEIDATRAVNECAESVRASIKATLDDLPPEGQDDLIDALEDLVRWFKSSVQNRDRKVTPADWVSGEL